MTSHFSKPNRACPVRCSRLAVEPVMKLSRATTSWPSASRRSHRWEPMKPAAPEMRCRKRNPPQNILAGYVSHATKSCYSAVVPVSLSAAEKWVLAVLLAASAAVFWPRIRPRSADHSSSQAGSGFHPRSAQPPRPGLRVGSAAPGQSHPPASASGLGARLRFLGILRVRAGDAEPSCRGIRVSVSGAAGRL